MNYRVIIWNEYENDIDLTSEDIYSDEESHPQIYVVGSLSEAKNIIIEYLKEVKDEISDSIKSYRRLTRKSLLNE